jgi:acyl-homoserine lactone acylase PvdQ
MKKIIIAIIIFMSVITPAYAFYSDSALVNLWNSRRDLQKAFPGDPGSNAKLETWAKKYGWKEDPTLFNYYPDKAVVEKIIDNKTNDRIAALEKQVAELTAKLGQTQSGQTTIIQQTGSEGIIRECRISGQPGRWGQVTCKPTDEDWPSYDNGSFYIKFLTK